MNVQVWSPGDSVTAPVVVCNAHDVASMRIAVAGNAAVRAFQIGPNGSRYTDLLRCFLELREDENWVPSGNFGGTVDSAWITRNLQRLASGLTHWDEASALTAVNLLKAHAADLHPQQVRFLDVVEGLISKVVKRILWGSPLFLAWPPPASARLWWTLSADLAVDVIGIATELKNCFGGAVPANVEPIARWLKSLHRRLTTEMFGGTREQSLLEASAFCEAVSLLHFSRGRYSLATLMCHRAADLMFTSLCASASLIDFTQNKGEGLLVAPVPTQRGPDSRLSLMNCHASLVMASVLPVDTVRETALENLNFTRNRLLLTHAVGTTKQSDTQVHLRSVHAQLKAHGGSAWETACNAYRTGVKLKPTDLFELSDGLMQSLQPI